MCVSILTDYNSDVSTQIEIVMTCFPGNGVRQIIDQRQSDATHFVLIFDRSEIGNQRLNNCLRDSGQHAPILKDGVDYWAKTNDTFLTILLTEHGVPYVSSAKNMNQLMDVVIPEVCIRIQEENGLSTFAAVVNHQSLHEIGSRLSGFIGAFNASDPQDTQTWEDIQGNLYIHPAYAAVVRRMIQQAQEEWGGDTKDQSPPPRVFRLENGDLKICQKVPGGVFAEVTVPAFMWQSVTDDVAKALNLRAKMKLSNH